MRWLCVGILVLSAVVAPAGAPLTAGAQASAQQPLDVIYVPTPPAVVAEMLSMARIVPGDVVLRSGIGRRADRHLGGT